MHTGLTPKPPATSYGEGFVFRVYKPVVQLRVVVGCGLKEEEEEVVVTHHAITGTIPSHRIIFMCVPRGCPKVFRRRSYLGCVGTTRLPQPPSVCFWIFFSPNKVASFLVVTRQYSKDMPCISNVVRHRSSTAHENHAIDSIWSVPEFRILSV